MKKVLVIDDDRMIQSLIKVHLAGESIELHAALDAHHGLQIAQAIRPDLCLLDLDLPDLDGFHVCRQLKENPATADGIVVFMTVESSVKKKIRGLDLGATDYITKPFDVAELRARVRACLRTKDLLDMLAHQAMIDGLTGLWNRAYFDQRLAEALAAAERHAETLACVIFDLDHFKRVNDDHGHAFGDHVLRRVGSILRDSARQQDTVCRFGGEEFILLLPHTSAEQASVLAGRLRDSIANLALAHDDQNVHLTASFGVADSSVAEGRSLVEAADQALYQAKNKGRNRVEIATPQARRVA